MDLLEQIVARAKADKQRIVLPEAEEERTLRAADKVLADDLANLILIGNPDNIRKEAAEWGLSHIDKATIVDPMNNPKSEEYAELLAELRKKKGMTIEQARELVTKNNLYLGCMIIKTDRFRVPSQPQATRCAPHCKSSSALRASHAYRVPCCSSARRSNMARTVLW